MSLPIADALADEVTCWLRETLGCDAAANPTMAYFLVRTLTGTYPERTPSCQEAVFALMEFCRTSPSREQMNRTFMTLFDMRTKYIMMGSWQSQKQTIKQPGFTLPVNQQLDASPRESRMDESLPESRMTAAHRKENAQLRKTFGCAREETPFDETAIEAAMRKQTNWKRRRAQIKQNNAKQPQNKFKPKSNERKGCEKWTRDGSGRLKSG